MQFSTVSISLFVLSVALQVLALLVLPSTDGFTRPIPTIGCSICYLAGIGLLARLSAQGVPLGILIPYAAAAVPLTMVIVGIFVFGEPASVVRVLLLVAACLIIGIASRT